MNKDNQIMSLLSDIDEEFIDDILEIPQKPVEGYGAVKVSGKGLFLKFAAPIAACLAVAGVAVGVLAAFGGNGVTPVVSEEVTTTAKDTLPEEISEEDLEDCQRYFESNMPDYSETEFTPHVMDVDFDGTYEIYYFPKYFNISNIYVFRKTHGSYNYSGEIDTNNCDYPLYDFADIKLFDRDGEKYYYYYYYNMQREEKGIAYFLPDHSVKSLLSYGCLNPYYMNSVTEGRSLRYCKKGDDYISDFEEFQRLWARYEGVPAIKYEEYWANEEVTLEGAEMLSDLPGDLPNFQEGNIIRGDCFYKNSTEKVIISQMDCGKDHKATILGYNVISYIMDGEIYVDCHKAKLVISDSSGKILSVRRAHSPHVRTKDDAGWEIPLATIENNICLDVVDFGENQVIMLRNSGDSVCEKTLLFGVKEDGTLYACVCTDLTEDERFSYCPYISGAYSIEGADTGRPTLVDSLTKNRYAFDFSSEDMISYSVIKGDTLTKDGGEVVNISEYIPVIEEEIPFIDLADLDFKEKAQAVLQNSLPKVLFKQESVNAGQSVYNFYLIAENVRRSIEGMHSNEYIYCNNVRTAIFKDGVYLGSVKGVYNYENSPFSLGTDFDEYIAKGYYCEEYDALLITKLDPIHFSEYGNRCFAAVKDGKLYPNLSGSWKDIDYNPKPEGLESSDEIEVNGNELSCGYYVYRFNFDDSGFGMGQYDFEVYWRDEGAE